MPTRLMTSLAFLCAAASLSNAEDIRLTLPPTGHAVVGSEMSIFFDNVVLIEKSDGLRFQVKSPLGKSEADRWTVTPQADEGGDHEFQIAVYRGDDKLAEKTMTWHVSPAKVASDREVRLLIIGDSLTHATVYPNDLAKRLTESGVKWKMLGTHRPAGAAEGVAHEGYGGWRWQTFLEHFEPNPEPDRAKRKHSSPFVFNVDGKPKFDLERYVREVCDGTPPDFVIISLGINDCFAADPSEPAKTDATIDAVFEHAETLIAAFRKAAPNAELGICLTTPGNARDKAFEDNYQGRYPRWGWKRIQHRLVERQLKAFSGRDAENIHVVPTELNLDTTDGYPENNGVHPNEAGYRQIAASIHAWLMSRLTETPR